MKTANVLKVYALLLCGGNFLVAETEEVQDPPRFSINEPHQDLGSYCPHTSIRLTHFTVVGGTTVERFRITSLKTLGAVATLIRHHFRPDNIALKFPGHKGWLNLSSRAQHPLHASDGFLCAFYKKFGMDLKEEGILRLIDPRTADPNSLE